MLQLRLAVNEYAFHWAYPEILADELGLFKKNGVKVVWEDATPARVVSKSSMYTGLLSRQETDVYHAGEWVRINRVLKSPDSAIVAKSPPGRGTLNSTFSLYVRKSSAIRRPRDLAGRTVAIEEGTGAQYTALADLERHLEPDEIRLVQVGEPHRRLLALLRGEVEAASLVGPWVDIGEAMGLRRVLKTSRKNPTTTVVRRSTDSDLLRRFFSSVNEAIGRLDSRPETFRGSYFRHIERILGEMPTEVSAKVIPSKVRVPLWRRWQPYTARDFTGTYRWMVSRGLAPAGHSAREVVAPYSVDLFG